MFEIFHASAMIGKWVEQLPVEVRSWLSESYWYFIAACLALLVWRLSRSEDTLPHGEVKLTWYRPSQWLQRWLNLRELGYSKAPTWFPKYMSAVQIVHQWISAFFVLILALFCLAMGWVWDDFSRVFWLIAGVFGLWWAWTMVRNAKVNGTQ